MTTASKKAAIERVRAVVEGQFIRIKSSHVRKDVAKLVRVEQTDYYLFKSGKWSLADWEVDHYSLEKPERGRERYNFKGRYRGHFRRAAYALSKLGLVSAADYEIVRLHIFDLDKVKRDRSTKRYLEWQAKQLGVKLVYPKKMLDDSNVSDAPEEVDA
jgi:hypothetical protein